MTLPQPSLPPDPANGRLCDRLYYFWPTTARAIADEAVHRAA